MLIREQRKKSLLSHFFRQIPITGHVQREPKHRAAVPAIQLNEALLVAFARPPKQVIVAEIVHSRWFPPHSSFHGVLWL
jgi:hypothetical protein